MFLNVYRERRIKDRVMGCLLSEGEHEIEDQCYVEACLMSMVMVKG